MGVLELLDATVRSAHHHPGLAFVRVLQRCPHYMPDEFKALQDDPSNLLLLEHPDGVAVDPAVRGMFGRRAAHDPADLNGARALAESERPVPVGLLYRNLEAVRYDRVDAAGLGMPNEEKLRAAQAEIDRFAV